VWQLCLGNVHQAYACFGSKLLTPQPACDMQWLCRACAKAFMFLLTCRVGRDVWAEGFTADAVVAIPLERWDPDGHLSQQLMGADGSLPLRFGVFLPPDMAAGFDAAAFGVSSTEAALMDPQQRLLLCTAAEVLMGRASRSSGAFVGISSMDYQKLGSRYVNGVTAYSATGVSLSVAAGRLSYTFGLQGPALAVDTACSSSLVAVHSAALSMAAGGCAAAVAAGANLTLWPDTPAMFKRAGMLAEDGRCKTLDAAADGYVRAEAVGAMLLQQLQQGATQGDVALVAVLAGAAVNQDGRSSSLTAPNGPAQQAVVLAALHSAGLSPGDVSSLSMHGTGTSLGDPIEVGAAAAVLVEAQQGAAAAAAAAAVPRGQTLVLASSKSWLGHAEPAAGIVGMVHAHHMLQQRSVCPIGHLRSLNPYVERALEGAPGACSLPRQSAGLAEAAFRAEQQAGQACGVSAFAFQGTNAHVLLQPTTAAVVDSSQTAPCTWQQQYLWVLPRAYGLLTSATSDAAAGAVTFVTPLDTPRLSFMWDHVVSGRSIFPAAGFLEAAAAAAKVLLPSEAQQVLLGAVTLPMALILPQGATGLQLAVQVVACTGQVQVHSSVEGVAGTSTHLTATFAVHQQQQLTVQMAEQLLGLLASWGVGAEPAVAAGCAGATGSLEASSAAHLQDHVLHPALLDSALQLGLANSRAAAGTSTEVKVPAAIEGVLVAAGATCHPAAAAAATHTDGAGTFTLFSSRGVSLGAVSRLVAKTISKPAAGSAALAASEDAAAAEPLYAVEWSAAQPAVEHAPAFGGVDLQLKQQTMFTLAASGMAALQQQLEVEECCMAAYLGCSSSGPSAACGSLVHPASAMVAGMLRAARNEQAVHLQQLVQQGNQAARLLVLEEAATAAEHASLYGGMSADGALFEPQLVETPPSVSHRLQQLVPEPRGSFGNLVPAPVDVTHLTPGQVALRVAAVGVNFRDVLNVLGMYPGDPGAPGGDCAGVVLAAGPGVSLQPGAAVFGLAVGSLGTAVVCNAGTLVAQPPNLSAEQAATMPTVFITAHMTLHAAAGVGEGDTVLLTAGAGGVGLAAGQVLSGVGARVVATAGSPSKRALLRGAGVEVVVGSRDSGFTGPLALLGGCDMVLNSLTSPGMVGGGLAVLKRGGRWVEIGKRDIWSAAAVGVERPDVGYSLVAVDFLPDGVVQECLLGVAAGAAAGRLRPLPLVSYGLGQLVAALRQMSQARHVGKVVVAPEPALQPIAADTHASLTVVVGGLGTLGSLVAQWLVQQGSQHLLLLGRSGKASSTASMLAGFDPLNGSSTQVIMAAADVAAAEDLQYALCGIPAQLGLPVGAVLHAGGVLADATVSKQSLLGLRQVLAPKVMATMACQQQLSLQPVSQQVLFSSVAALLGSPGQSNYAAANAALDAAAGALQGAGLGVVSVQWGAWAGAGMAAADASTAARVARSGMALLQPAQGLAALSDALCMLANSSISRPAVAAIPFRWGTFFKSAQQLQEPLFREFAEAQALPGPATSTAGPTRRAAAAGGQAPEQLQVQVQAAVAGILGRVVAADEPLVAAGLDSLGSVELRNQLQARRDTLALHCMKAMHAGHILCSLHLILLKHTPVDGSTPICSHFLLLFIHLMGHSCMVLLLFDQSIHYRGLPCCC
jgi:NADPH:quinone reductase-like Zn-dependent oxidoreductase/3-oxoacyl-(acyl-carrier-protein) synthase